MSGNEHTDNVPIASSLVAFLLWLVTAVAGLWQIGLIRDMIIRLTFRFQTFSLNRYDQYKQQQAAGGMGILIVLMLGLVWIAVVIGGAEYHRRRIGKPESWRLFSRVVAVELAVALLPLFV